MQFNPRFIPAAVMAALAVSSSAFASDGTISFEGAVSDATCNISVNGSGPDGTVTLPTVSLNSLAQAGDTAGTTPFRIALSGCAGTANTARAYFEPGPTVDPVQGKLRNTGGTAGNVYLALLDSNHAPLHLGDPALQNDAPVDISGGGELGYHAQYYAVGPATAGSVLSLVNYTIVYE
ncbi:fimbrial protein [Bordetella petrii]|uniref:fimbrial protein n=1 Tax=Bordetella petrii TaxID=94624 RepID=UPI001E3D5F46|nr:fimbrial protein [Bordetella petrii]MCD0502946.1 type 1 fimbrial protein [Bordetella petrii]